VTVSGTVTNWRKKMKELKEILEGLDKINAKLEEVLVIQQTCYNSLCDVWVAPPHKSPKEVLDEIHE
jgi:hypothetical protein